MIAVVQVFEPKPILLHSLHQSYQLDLRITYRLSQRCCQVSVQCSVEQFLVKLLQLHYPVFHFFSPHYASHSPAFEQSCYSLGGGKLKVDLSFSLDFGDCSNDLHFASYQVFMS